tara:strand:+ start:279 stop:479 length:201 start_codon:yes stop_codon:yes gene_type:complete
MTDSISGENEVRDAQSPLSIVEFTRRQVAVLERQMLSATDLADLLDLAIAGIRQLSSVEQSLTTPA